MKAKLSRSMLEVLEAIAQHERNGMIGAMPELYNQNTILALSKRDLIEPNVDGSRRLTKKGWAAVR